MSVSNFIFMTLFLLTACNNTQEPSGALHGPENSVIRPPTGMVYIPPGEFNRGSDPEKEPAFAKLSQEQKDGYRIESPENDIFQEGFYIDRYEVTFMEYNLFLKATAKPLPEGWNNYDFSHSPNFPVFGITWEEANAYAKWAGKRLPTEAEWEKAARGANGKRYVWGDDFYKGMADQLTNVLQVGTRLIDRSPYQVFDMAGNVAEWTVDDFAPYSGSDYHDPQYGQGKKVVKGYFSPKGNNYPYADIYYRMSARYGFSPGESFSRVGFRCAMDVKIINDDIVAEQGDKLDMEMIYVPPGPFVMGTDIDKEKAVPDSYGLDQPAYQDETPQQTVYLNGFYIDRYEVTIDQYRQFLKAKNRQEPPIWEEMNQPDTGKLPVFGITWAEAAEYAQWVGKRLPTEEEWEKAARGTGGIKLLWGEKGLDKSKTNLYNVLVPVDKFVMFTSPYGSQGMAGNVSEWTDSWYEPYPGNKYPNENYGKKYKVVKGASFKETGHYNIPYFLRLACRGHVDPSERFMNIGFRCAKDLSRVAYK